MYRIPFPTKTRDQNTEMALLMHTATLSQVVWIQGHGSSYQLQHEKLSQRLVAKTAKIILLSLVIIQEGLLWLMLAPRRSGATVTWWLVASQAPPSSAVFRLPPVVSPQEFLCPSSQHNGLKSFWVFTQKLSVQSNDFSDLRTRSFASYDLALEVP